MVPKVIHRQWFGPRDMPDRYREYGQAWLDLNPGWELIDHDYSTLPPLRNEWEFTECGRSWTPGRGDQKQASLIQVTQADIGAYEILWSLGGLYVNCDMRPIRPIPTDLTERDITLAYEIDGVLISNAWMMSEPQHPVMNAVIEALPENVRTCDRGVDHVTGPRLLTRVVSHSYPDTHILPARYCNPWLPTYEQQIHEDTICVHEWGHATRDEDLWPTEGRQAGEQRYF
jgi:mannosyltransferase OCH1-like enzyme